MEFVHNAMPADAVLQFSKISAAAVPHGDVGAKSGNTRSDPFVRFVLLGQEGAGGYEPTACKTSTLSNTENPRWPDSPSISLPRNFQQGSVRCTVWDSDSHSDDDALGAATLAITLAKSGAEQTIELKGFEQAGVGGYKFPNFKLTLTYTIGPKPKPPAAAATVGDDLLFGMPSAVAACLRPCVDSLAASAKARKQASLDEAASLIQNQAAAFLRSNPAFARPGTTLQGMPPDLATPSKSKPPSRAKGGGVGASGGSIFKKLKSLGGAGGFQSLFAATVDKSDAGLAKAFAKIDADGSGKVSASEMKAYITKLYGVETFNGPSIDEQVVTDMMNAADTDGDGEIDLDEFKVIMRAGPDKKGSAAGAAPKPAGKARYNTLRPSPQNAKYKLCVVQFKVAGAKNGGSDKGPDGNRIDSIPIANGVIAAGGACDLMLYEANDHDLFVAATAKYDALIVRINPGQLSQGTPEGTQARFDDLMNSYIAQGKLVWSSPKIQTQMGAKDALVKIANMNCGLPDTYAYYDETALVEGFKKCCAYQPRVIKQNRGSAGEGIWLCWLANEDKTIKGNHEYPAKTFGEVSLGDGDMLKLMEMNDNHVEYHTVKEFMTFCVGGPDAPGAGKWESTFPGKYLEGGKAAGGQLVDQRLLPRIDEGEVRILMAGDTCQMAVHKKPMGGGLSAVGGNSDYTYYTPTDAKYKKMIQKLYADIPSLLPAMGLGGEPLPLLWTCDYIPKNPEGWDKAENASDAETEYVVGEFNCSCVGISKFQAVCGGEKTLADVSDADYFDACELTDLMGVKAIEMLKKATASVHSVHLGGGAGVSGL